MSNKIVMKAGEATIFSEGKDVTAAMPEILIGKVDGPVGQSFANLMGPVESVVVGGGLAVDYDGSRTSFHASANYGLQEYADTVVYTILETCQETGVSHPVVVSESGRALTAHHAVLVLPVIDAVGPTRASATSRCTPTTSPSP